MEPMRIAGSVVVLCFLAAPSLADKPADPRLAYVDDEPMSHRAVEPPRAGVDRRTPEDVGQLRPAAVSAPAPTAVDSGPMATRDHAVVAPHIGDAPTAGASDLMTELAARQLAKETRRHQRDIDGCVSAAQRRRPAAVGTVTLSLTITHSALADVFVANDAVNDTPLAACLVRTARTFKFSLAAAQIAWPVTLTPSAAR
jgi:hypothetical protein